MSKFWIYNAVIWYFFSEIVCKLYLFLIAVVGFMKNYIYWYNHETRGVLPNINYPLFYIQAFAIIHEENGGSL